MRSLSHSSSGAEEIYYEALDRLAQDDAPRAAALFRQCLEREPRMLDAMHGLIRALQECGELDQAIATACRLAELNPEEALAHTSLSILYQKKGLIPEAEAEALKAKLLDWKRQLKNKKAEA